MQGGESGVFMATSQAALDEALRRSFSQTLLHVNNNNLMDAPMAVVRLPTISMKGYCACFRDGSMTSKQLSVHALGTAPDFLWNLFVHALRSAFSYVVHYASCSHGCGVAFTEPKSVLYVSSKSASFLASVCCVIAVFQIVMCILLGA